MRTRLRRAKSFTGKHPFTRTWVHNGMLRLGTEKMSKSLGNLVLAQDLLKRYSSDAIRLYLHGERYRDSFAFDEDKLKAAQRLADSLALVAWLPGGNGDALDVEHLRDAFLQALEDDLDMATAIQTLSSLAEVIADAHEGHRDTYSAQAELRALAGYSDSAERSRQQPSTSLWTGGTGETPPHRFFAGPTQPGSSLPGGRCDARGWLRTTIARQG